MDLGLRPAGPADVDDVVAIHVATRLDAEARSVMPPGIHPPHEAHAWLSAKMTGEAPDEVWLAEVDGRPAGYARLTATWLDDLYVHPDHAGQGIGTALLDLAMSVRPGGFCLWVFEMNTPAREFYLRRGLVDLERTDGEGNEEKSPDVRMAWPGIEPLAFFRRMVDEVDEQLGDLLARRAALTRAIQPHKTSPGRDAERERAIAEALARRAPALGADRLARIVDAIISESLGAADEATRGAPGQP